MGHLQKINAEIARQGRSKKDVQLAAGLSHARLSRAKNGMLKMGELRRVAEVLGVPVETFLDEPAVAGMDPFRPALDALVVRYGTENCVNWIQEGAKREGLAGAQHVVQKGFVGEPPPPPQPGGTNKVQEGAKAPPPPPNHEPRKKAR